MRKLLVLLSFVFVVGCASQPQETPDTDMAMLLVAMEDGRFVMQEIAFDADICWKMNGDPKTGCFKKGEAVIDPATDQIVGYEMLKSDLALHAKK